MSAFAARFNRLPIWHRRVRVWGADFRACSLDRLVYLTLHRLGFMGKEERAFFESQIKPGMNIAEAGANIGVYTIQLSRLAGPEGRVFAFEPDPHLFACLCENLDRAEVTNVEAHHCALGSAPGKLSLAWDGLNSGDTHLSREAQAGAAQVDVARLDTVLAGKRVDFFKLDVQGWELEVLRGMTGLFAGCKAPGAAEARRITAASRTDFETPAASHPTPQNARRPLPANQACRPVPSRAP